MTSLTRKLLSYVALLILATGLLAACANTGTNTSTASSSSTPTTTAVFSITVCPKADKPGDFLDKDGSTAQSKCVYKSCQSVDTNNNTLDPTATADQDKCVYKQASFDPASVCPQQDSSGNNLDVNESKTQGKCEYGSGGGSFDPSVCPQNDNSGGSLNKDKSKAQGTCVYDPSGGGNDDRGFKSDRNAAASQLGVTDPSLLSSPQSGTGWHLSAGTMKVFNNNCIDIPSMPKEQIASVLTATWKFIFQDKYHTRVLALSDGEVTAPATEYWGACPAA